MVSVEAAVGHGKQGGALQADGPRERVPASGRVWQAPGPVVVLHIPRDFLAGPWSVALRGLPLPNNGWSAELCHEPCCA